MTRYNLVYLWVIINVIRQNSTGIVKKGFYYNLSVRCQMMFESPHRCLDTNALELH